MARHLKEKHFIKKPTYKGGLTAMRKFIAKQLKYPEEALKNKIEGKVMVNYEVSHLGKVTSTTVMNKLGYGCDEEAERVIKMLKFEIPKIPYKARVSFKKSIKINFKLPIVKSSPTQKTRQVSSIKYTLTNKKQPTEKQPTTYTYTINL